MEGAVKKEFSEDDPREMEFEALMSIYEDELKLSFDENNSINYQIDLKDINAVLIFQLSEKYPDISPDIKVVQPSNHHFVKLENLLSKLSEDMVGEVMIFDLIEEAKKWAEENKLSTDSEQSPPSPLHVCKFYLEGKCKFGEKCRNSHPDSTAARSNQQDIKDTSASCETLRNDLTKEPKTGKKSPMKTASDVISRIQWDERIDASCFSIGYLDRFIGIIEKPFTDFSWEDIASADYTVLSIPRHRIQFFKYRSQIVWDKRERLDNVFGSTGSGITIYDLIENQTEEDEKGEVLPVEPNENLIVDAMDMEQLSPKNGNRGKAVPNYFLAFKVKDEEILKNIDKLQKEIVSREQGMVDGLIHPQQFHITLRMLTLKNDAELTLVKDILKGIQHTLPSILPASEDLDFKGVGSFKDRILYVKVEDDQRLQKWVHLLTAKLKSAGICLDGNRQTFFPHLTVLRMPCNSKISPSSRRKTLSSLEMEHNKTVFGRQGVDSVGLFSRFDSKDACGFHAEVFHFENSFFAVFPTLKDKVLKYLEKVEIVDRELKEKAREILTKGANLYCQDQVLQMLIAEHHKQQRQRHSLQQEKQGNQGLERQDRFLVILRGIPGSGKTSFLESRVEYKHPRGLVVCSPKQLFYRAGNSAMDQADTNIAEAYCRNAFLEALSSEASAIAVDDCHSQCWHYSVYQNIAAVFGVKVVVLEISCIHRESIIQCQQSSNESLDDLLKLVEQWEDDKSAVCIEPWFNNPDIKDGGSLRDLLNP